VLPRRAGDEEDVGAEAQRFFTFVSPGVDHNVRFEVVE
jgi:hypothetical protein